MSINPATIKPNIDQLFYLPPSNAANASAFKKAFTPTTQNPIEINLANTGVRSKKMTVLFIGATLLLTTVVAAVWIYQKKQNESTK